MDSKPSKSDFRRLQLDQLRIQQKEVKILREQKEIEEILSGYEVYDIPDTICGTPEPEEEPPVAPPAEDTSNDLAIARILQHELNLKHDDELDVDIKRRNKSSKVTLSVEHRKILPSRDCADEDNVRRPEENDPIDYIQEEEQLSPALPSCGYRQDEDGAVVTKHDAKAASRNNTRKMMHGMPCNVNTGDAADFPLTMDNSVYNSFNQGIIRTNNQKARKHDQSEKAILGSLFDSKLGEDMIALRNNGMIDEFSGLIAKGKEAMVYGAVTGEISPEIEPLEKCVLKIFKLRSTEFKTRSRYIEGDHRFHDRISKRNMLHNIHLWVEKEYRNLHRAYKNELPCPMPLFKRGAIIAMSFIGNHETMEAAPRLKTINCLGNTVWERAYEQTIQIVEDLLHKCHLVHADLSEYNLLLHNKKVYVIDFAQSVDLTHPNAIGFLYRDLCTVSRFFKKQCVQGVKSGFELLESVTGITIKDHANIERSDEEKVRATEQALEMWRASGDYSDEMFEFLWRQSNISDAVVQNLKKTMDDAMDLSVTEIADPWFEEKTEKDADCITPISEKRAKRLRKIAREQERAKKQAEFEAEVYRNMSHLDRFIMDNPPAKVVRNGPVKKNESKRARFPTAFERYMKKYKDFDPVAVDY